MIGVWWVDPDGGVWDWVRGTEGARLESADGLGKAPGSTQSTTSAGQAGRTYRGTTYDYRAVPLKLFVGDTDNRDEPRRGAEWVALDAAVKTSLDEERPGYLLVQSASGVRRMQCRVDEYAAAAGTKAPHLLGRESYNLVLAADVPWFEGFPSVRTLTDSTTSRVYNGGDVESWPVTRVDGPATGTATATIVVDGQATTLTTVTAGQSVIFDSHPERRTVLDQDGNNRRSGLGSPERRAPVPRSKGGVPGSVPVSYSYVGTNPTVTVTVPQLYRAAW